jgi:D-alanyl-lipoteichoic acid acyltransferase DltB (MBOAT superfamily)
MAHSLSPINRFAFLALFIVGPFLYDFWYFNTRISNKLETTLADIEFLQPSWLTPLIGRKMDLKDNQWVSFRSSLPLLCLAFGIQILLRRFVPRNHQELLNGWISLVWLVILHRVDAFFLLFVFLVNYSLLFYTRLFPWKRTIMWTLNLTLLYSTKRFENFLHPNPLDPFVSSTLLSHSKGVLPWWLSFNLLFLRLISFVEDVLGSNPAIPQPSFLSVVFYLAYPPLYIAGPTIRFEEFRKQLAAGSVVPTSLIKTYLPRFLFLLLSFEIFSSYIYATSIARSLQFISLEINTLEDIQTTAFWSFASLFGAWFKFAIIWRFARLVSLLDGVNPPENMKGCIGHTINFRVFWKEWHCSFNAWLVRYVYIPLGGNRKGAANQVFASICCFLFVASWHDFEWRLVVWGVGLSAALIPEVLAHRFAEHSKVALWLQQVYPFGWDILTGFFGAWAIMGLLFLNMFGYTLHSHTWVLMNRMSVTEGAGWFFIQWFGWMWVAAIIKLQSRRREKSSEIDEDKRG